MNRLRNPSRVPKLSLCRGGAAGRRALAAALVALGLAGCGPAPTASGINDPYETHNRGVHAFNKRLDRALLGPGSEAYGTVIPEPLRQGVQNVAGNLDMPRMVVNDILQGNVDDAVANAFRFAINSTFGLAGVLDPASDMGLTARNTDFGETLHVWGLREGRYLELPVLGPSTERDAVGKVVDIALNPLRYAVPEDEQTAITLLGLFSRFGDRYRFSGMVESILYESADSYAQARVLYLQNRRFALGGTEGPGDENTDADPYDDPYADPLAQ